MPIKKKQKKVATKGFLDAAKIADSLAKIKKSKKAQDKNETKTKTTLTKVTVVEEKTPSNDVSHQKGKSLAEIKKTVSSPDEIEGFEYLNEENNLEKHEEIKIVDKKSSGVIEMIGGVTMILILVEVVVILGILIFMFFAK